MAIQDFVAGQVLTAAQMDSLQANDYNWTVSNKTASYTLVAADKGTRIVMSNAGATERRVPRPPRRRLRGWLRVVGDAGGAAAL